MRIAMGKRAANAGHIPDSHIGKRAERALHHRKPCDRFAAMLQFGQRHHRADPQSTLRVDSDFRITALDLREADEPRRGEHTSLHHQHQSRAAGNRANGGIVGIEERDGFHQRIRFRPREGDHDAASATPLGKAARNFSMNCRSISLAFDFSTGWPMLPRRPVKLASTAYLMIVSSPVSTKVAMEVADNRPTMPCGLPSILASMVWGRSARVMSTTTSNLKRIYAILVSNSAV